MTENHGSPSWWCRVVVVPLLLQSGLVLGSHFGYVEWSDNDRDERNPSVFSTYIPTYPLPATERAVVAHKIEEDLPRVVTAFLHTGDSSALRQVNCSRRYELSSLRGGLHVASHYSLHSILDTVAHATNFLNVILQPTGPENKPRARDMQWYHALVQSILEGDPKIHRAVVTLHTDAFTPGPHVYLQATRGEHEEVVLQDLSGSAHRYLRSRGQESEWFNEFRDGRRPQVHRRAQGSVGGGYLLDQNHIKWSAPYLECEHGAFVPYWLLTLSAAFYGLKSNSAPEFRGVVRVDVNLQDVDIDQCSSNGWFAGTHRCNLTSMECTPLIGHGFVLDKYKCQCRRGFYHPSRVALNGFKSKAQHDVSDLSSKCLPCRDGCPFCRDDMPCLVQEDGALRRAVASFQGLCMVLDLACMMVVYHLRKNKCIRASGLILLETILFGALLLYFPVVTVFFNPSVFRCILLRWVRLLGFAIMYGTVILKLYRVLKVFLSRTAQRTPYMTGWRVLGLLAVILLVVLWFLVAWTSAVCQNPELSQSLIAVGLTPEGLQFSMCLLDRWDHMMAVAEFMFLLWGVYLCYAVRTIPSAFHEPRYIAVAIYNELLISAIFHIIRFALVPGLHPDWMLMLYFAHTHLTVTVTLGLLLIPKFLSKGTQARDDIATEAFEEELDMGRSGSYLNNSITSAWSEHSLDPEDIRDELKKLYAQLEVYKRKKMLANNPHLQKKRNSKKGLGRSLMKRITEIPDSMHLHRQCSRDDGSEHGSNRSTLRRNPFEPSHHVKPQDDSLKDKVPGLNKSLSYDHVCDQEEETASQTGSTTGDKMTPVGNGGEASLLGSLVGRKHAKKQLEPAATPPILEPAESTESVPLFWKSASAHNLMHEKKPVHLRTTIMQKSLSVIASAKDKMPGLTSKTQSVEDASKKGLKGQEGRMLAEVDETPEHYPKMIISQSVEYSKTPLKMGIMKQQVSGSQPSICSETGRNLYDVSEVCSWEMEEPQTPTEIKTQKHVSIAPGETTAGSRRGSSSTSGVAKGNRSSQRQKPGQSPSNRRRIKEKAGEREEGREIRKPRPPSSPLPLKLDVCPWEFDEQPIMSTGGDPDSLSPDRIRRKKSVTPTDGKPKGLHSDYSKSTGSLLQPPSLMVDICPWDYTSPPSPKQERSCNSPTTHKKKRKGSCSSNHKTEKDKAREKSRERRSSSSKPSSERRRVSQSSECGGPHFERRRSSSRDPDVLYRESEPSHSSLTQTKKSPERKKEGSLSTSYKPVVISRASMVDVCPWDFQEQDSGERA
ncbi:LOW QUALITY PROTEIN: probable G-protein coupled receptor 158 [Gouania willdenowi]|uniref:LOW QUALITY PROTEIN: probable G-protein coupled receptor 158 n=1 Tax=Gouania willdenowi TaxID=441366 RepID=UPI0010569EDE|nr:LOW QUALITY PROTEIN: probable G-protein coupled receptor 158 [Gouania willdenowi]